MDSLFLLPTQALPPPRSEASPITLSSLCSAAQPTEAGCDLSLQSSKPVPSQDLSAHWGHVLRFDPTILLNSCHFLSTENHLFGGW